MWTRIGIDISSIQLEAIARFLEGLQSGNGWNSTDREHVEDVLREILEVGGCHAGED